MIEHRLRICPNCNIVIANGYLTCPVCGPEFKTKPYAVAFSEWEK